MRPRALVLGSAPFLFDSTKSFSVVVIFLPVYVVSPQDRDRGMHIMLLIVIAFRFCQLILFASKTSDFMSDQFPCYVMIYRAVK